jgi:hypothetical protein
MPETRSRLRIQSSEIPRIYPDLPLLTPWALSLNLLCGAAFAVARGSPTQLPLLRELALSQK